MHSVTTEAYGFTKVNEEFNGHKNLREHLKHLFLVCSSIGGWFIRHVSKVLVTILDQCIWSILRAKLSINTCTFLVIIVLVICTIKPFQH